MFNVDMAFKKIINDPYQVVDEMVEGIVLAHSDLLKFANCLEPLFGPTNMSVHACFPSGILRL